MHQREHRLLPAAITPSWRRRYKRLFLAAVCIITVSATFMRSSLPLHFKSKVFPPPKPETEQPPLNKYTCKNENYRLITSAMNSSNLMLQKNLLSKSPPAPPLMPYEDGSVFPESSVNNLFPYSAFLDQSDANFWIITIVSFVPSSKELLRRAKLETRCYMDYGNGTQRTLIKISDVPEHLYGPHKTSLVVCMPHKKNSPVPPLRVAIGSARNASNLHWMKVYTPQTSQKAFLSLCLAPFLGNYTRLTLMVEFFSYYTAMGVEQYHVYLSDDVTEDVKLLLLRLHSRGKVKINFHRWNVDFNRSFVPVYGQLSALHDCIYRCKTSSKYVVYADVDEYIVPHKDQTLVEAITRLERSNRNISLGIILIRQWMFCYEYPANHSLLRSQPFLHTRAQVARESNAWEYKERSKYIVATKAAVIAGIHFIWTLRPGWWELRVAPSDLVVNHYRHCCGTYTTMSNPNRVILNSTDIVIDRAIGRLKWDIMKSPAFQAIAELLE